MRTLEDLADVVSRALARHESMVCRRPVLVATSGGADSMALANAVGRLHHAERIGGEPILVHFDHGQADESFRSSSAALVAELAWDFGMRVQIARLDLPPGASEARMRDARYAALIRTAREFRAAAVLTAHHADDELETVLFRMLRGTGTRGLAGIPRARWLAPGVLALRPFLEVRGHDLRRALEHAGAKWIEDPSNADPEANTRAAIRHLLLPQLREQHGRRFEADLFAVARVARATTAVLEAEATRLLTASATSRADGAIVDLDLRERSGLLADEPEVFRETLRQIHERMVGSSPTGNWLDRAVGLLKHRTGQRLDGGGGVLAERTRIGVSLWAPDRVAPLPIAPCDLRIDAPAVAYGESGWRFEVVVRPTVPLDPGHEAGDDHALLDAANLHFPLRIRRARSEDRFRPLGSHEPVSLKNFLQKRGVPSFDRGRWPVVVDGDDDARIVWVPGVEIADDVRVRTVVDPIRDPNRRHPTRACLELRAISR